MYQPSATRTMELNDVDIVGWRADANDFIVCVRGE